MYVYNNYTKWLSGLKKGDRVIVKEYNAFTGTTTYMTYVEQVLEPFFFIVDGVRYNKDGFNQKPSIYTTSYNQLIQPY